MTTPTPTPTNTLTPTPTFTPVASGLPEQKLFVLRGSERRVVEYLSALPNLFIDLALTGVDFDVSEQCGNPQGVFVDASGGIMFVVDNTAGGSGAVYRYDLSVAWDLSTALYTGQFLDVSVNPENSFLSFQPSDINFNPDGSTMYIMDNSRDAIFQWNLGGAFDLSTATFVQSVSIRQTDAKPYLPVSFSFNTSGSRIFVLDQYTQTVDQWDLSLTFDLSTAVYSKRYRLQPVAQNVQAVEVSADGTRLLVDIETSVQTYAMSVVDEVDSAEFVGVSGDGVGGRTSGFNIREMIAATAVPTPTVTSTVTPSPTPTSTVTASVTPSVTPTNTVTPTSSVTPTPTVTVGASATPTPTADVTPTVTPSVTPTNTVTPTVTASVSVTPSVTPTQTAEVTPTVTPSNTVTPSVTPTNTVTPTVTATVTPTQSAAVTPTATVTPTVTVTVTPTISLTASVTPTATVTPTVTETVTPTPTQTVTPSPSTP